MPFKNSRLGCRLKFANPLIMLLTGVLVRRSASVSEPHLTLWQRGGGAARGRRCVHPQCAAGWDEGPTPLVPLRPWPWRLGSTARCRWGFEGASKSDPSTLRSPGPGRLAAPLKGSWSPSWSANPRPDSIPPPVPGYTWRQTGTGCSEISLSLSFILY